MKQLSKGSRKNDTRYAARGVKKMKGRKGEEGKGKQQDNVLCIIGDV